MLKKEFLASQSTIEDANQVKETLGALRQAFGEKRRGKTRCNLGDCGTPHIASGSAVKQTEADLRVRLVGLYILTNVSDSDS
jgi:hypothetical protein